MIVLVPIGELEEVTVEALRQPLTGVFSQRTRIGDKLQLPRDSWNQHRGQHLASLLLAELPSLPHLGDRVLGVADVDIFAPGLNFVFGEASSHHLCRTIPLALPSPFYRPGAGETGVASKPHYRPGKRPAAMETSRN